MTEVLPAPSEGSSHFSSGPIRRTSSHASVFLVNNPTSYLKSSQKPNYIHNEYGNRISTSVPSSAPSSPQLSHTSFSNQPSYTSTPESSLSLNTTAGVEEDSITFPSYDGVGYFGPSKETDLEPPTSPISDNSTAASTTDRSRPDSPVPKTAGDDNAIENEPTRHVDYLSHDWKEEDIWSSWRYIVARRNVYSNSVRLENASWRTWTKSKYRLRTVSPGTLNWLKESDVTWLYGPLQTDTKKPILSTSSPPPSRLSTSSSFLNKKPILKKKSASEAILHRSLSAHTLLKHAGAILQAQETGPRSRRSFGTASDFTMSESSPTPLEESYGPTSTAPSMASSGLQSPGERRHIHFNNEVVQCIAVEAKGGDEEGGEEGEPYSAFEDDESEDEGMVMMKELPARARISNRSTPRTSFSNESKTIAPLPSTTLKYRGDTPEPADQSARTLGGFWPSGSKLSPSPSQETLRPTKPSSNFVLDDGDEDADLQWQPPGTSNPRKDSIFINQNRLSNADSDDESDAGPGLRRTPSGMFMPYENDEELALNAGLFGRVVDTVNTARDIAHVIWNVGWRR